MLHPNSPRESSETGPSMTTYRSPSFCIPRTCLNPNIIAPTPYYAGPWRSSLNILFTNPCAGRSCCATKEPERGPNYHVKQNFFQLAHYKLLPKTRQPKYLRPYFWSPLKLTSTTIIKTSSQAIGNPTPPRIQTKKHRPNQVK